MAEITFVTEVNDTSRAEILKYVNALSWLIPSWCRDLYITIYNADNSDDRNGSLSTMVKYEYRRVTLYVYGGFFVVPAERLKWIDMIHEFIHFNNAAYVDFAEDNFSILAKDDTLQILKESSRMYCESMTQDLAVAIFNKLVELKVICLEPQQSDTQSVDTH